MPLTPNALQKQITVALHRALASRDFAVMGRRALLRRTLSFGTDLVWVHAAKRGTDKRILAAWVYVGVQVEAVERLVVSYDRTPVTATERR